MLLSTSIKIGTERDTESSGEVHEVIEATMRTTSTSMNRWKTVMSTLRALREE